MIEEQPLVEALQAAHQSALEHTSALAEARQRRRDVAVKLHEAGRSYRWIGDQIGVTPQAVESLLKYHQRRAAKLS